MNKPFLKWAGSKRKLITTLQEYIGQPNYRLIEPFVGSGTVFLNIKAESYILSDLNYDLITLFKLLQQDNGTFIKYVKKEFFTTNVNTEDTFYRLRSNFNTETDPFIKSALFIYLNRHAFNGLCRYNKSGKFNVPYGRYKTIYFPEKELIYFSNSITNCTFLHQDFRQSLANLRPTDVVYCDPPYSPVSKTSSFTGYCPGGFNDQDQIDLINIIKQLDNKVIISNNFTDFIKGLYTDADKLVELQVQKNIGSKGDSRKKVKEILAIYNY